MPDPSALATAIHARAAALQAISQRGRRSSWHRARVPRRPLGRHVRPTVGKTSRAKICRSSAHVPIELRGDMTADTETLPCVRGTTTIQNWQHRWSGKASGVSTETRAPSGLHYAHHFAVRPGPSLLIYPVCDSYPKWERDTK